MKYRIFFNISSTLQNNLDNIIVLMLETFLDIIISGTMPQVQTEKNKSLGLVLGVLKNVLQLILICSVC